MNDDRYKKTFDFCVCGQPERVKEFLTTLLDNIKHKFLEPENSRLPENEVLTAYPVPQGGFIPNPKANKDNCYSLAQQDLITNDPLLTLEVLLHLLDEKGLLDHGGSIGGSWLSDDGEELLEGIQATENEEE